MNSCLDPRACYRDNSSHTQLFFMPVLREECRELTSDKIFCMPVQLAPLMLIYFHSQSSTGYI